MLTECNCPAANFNESTGLDFGWPFRDYRCVEWLFFFCIFCAITAEPAKWFVANYGFVHQFGADATVDNS